MPRVLVDLLSYTGTKGGMETYARELYREIGRMDTPYEFVGFASRELMTKDHSWFPGEVVDSGYSGENRVVWAYGELVGVGKGAARLGADVIHCPATLGPRRTSVPTVITMHDMLYFSHPQLMSTPLYTEPVKWMEKQAARNATRILTDSEASAAEIRKYLGFDASRLEVVPLAGTPASGTVPTDLTRRPDLVIAVGNRRPHKNWEGLVRALPYVDESVRPTLVVTGSHGEDPLRPVVAELGLERWVDLRTWVSAEELDELYATASILAMPSFCDGFCLPALEAMMVGLPVMLSDIPVYREVAADAGLYFDPHDHRSIARAITRAVTEPELLARLTADGYEQAARFSWRQVAEQTLAAFDTAIAEYPALAARRR
ncbi:MAG TPA: glycosyltransferase family 1 protein [Actinotalea sp.]|nr:glycosyltransferase family 1 protein [Actinotalea sp.]